MTIPPAGRERDKLIAELKGLNPELITYTHHNKPDSLWLPYKGECPHWSTSRNDAWELWDELQLDKKLIQTKEGYNVTCGTLDWYIGTSFPDAVSKAWIEWKNAHK